MNACAVCSDRGRRSLLLTDLSVTLRNSGGVIACGVKFSLDQSRNVAHYSAFISSSALLSIVLYFLHSYPCLS